MVNRCCVTGCTNTDKERKDRPELRFYRFPVWKRVFGPQMEDISRRRRQAWIRAVRRKDVTFEHVQKHLRVCSMHFHSGQPSYEMMETDPDWAPSLRLGHKEIRPTNPARFERRLKREQQRTQWLLQRNTVEPEPELEPELKPEPELELELEPELEPEPEIPCSVPGVSEINEPSTHNALTQTHDTPERRRHDPRSAEECDLCVTRRDEIHRLLEENWTLKRQLAAVKFSDGFFADGGDEKVRYYTGLPSFTTFTDILTGLLPLMSHEKKALTPFQNLLLTLIRLRLDLPVQLLANLFLVSQNTVYRAFRETISNLHALLKHAIIWPDRDAARKNTPPQFVEAFGDRMVVIVDSFEILTDKPANDEARAQMFSPRKRAHTVKYLIGTTPRGAVCLLSSGWGGATDDERLVVRSGLPERLRPGDVVLAPGGFGARDGAAMLCADVTAEGLLEPRDAQETGKVRHLKNDVKRGVADVCQTYRMLSGAVPISLLLPSRDEKLTFLDKMVTVCCACANICPDI